MILTLPYRNVPAPRLGLFLLPTLIVGLAACGNAPGEERGDAAAGDPAVSPPPVTAPPVSDLEAEDGRAGPPNPAEGFVDPVDPPLERDLPGPSGGETNGGDGSSIVLQPLGAADIERIAPAGELACSFATEKGEAPLLLARADVTPDGAVSAAYKMGGTPYPAMQGRAGGFSDLSDGISLAARGLALRIEPTGADRAEHEGSVRPATLTVLRGDGGERTYTGFFTCGP
ncbi:hypothetical protein B5C34_03630 [Pacificimonas flava]|uniref:Lipoprotein n=2 Tax=Pacificimonas TaxID=1960290 RepID=A0A219B4B7_9SPHN|nr:MULTISPECIES: hypothetical protein [Pacificimonas]MBZ6377691.1 hypothetical protein [Pacificimonas aurantium]OWV32628.1 hypothetical protein B5C34_03630 [Pacificimonas flava]